MADRSISELNPATSIGATDLFVLQQAGAAKKLTGQTLENWLLEMADGHGGIQSISKTGTSGADPVVDTYTITYADTSTSTFTVTNGRRGATGAQTYVHIKYSAIMPVRDADMGNIPDNYMGIYVGLSSSAPTTYTSYSWNRVRGVKGDTGDPAYITNQSVQYQASNSGTIIPSGVWTNSIPAVAQGQYLWTRTIVTYNSGTTTTAYSVGYKGMDGLGAGDMLKAVYDAQGSVADAGGISAFVSGQLPQAAQVNPQMDGVASVGSSSAYARADHRHPADTTRAKTDLSNVSNGAVKVAMLDTGAVTAVKIQDGAVSAFYTVSVDTSWTGSTAPYTKTVTVNGLLSTDHPKIDFVPSDTFDTAQAEKEAWSLVYKAVANTNSLTLYAEEIPQTALTLQIECVRK